MKRLVALAALAAASASAVEMTDGGFTVTERAKAVSLVTLRHGGSGDLRIDRIDVTDPATDRRRVRFADDSVAYYVCTNSDWFGIERNVAAAVSKVGGRWTEVRSAPSAEGVRITSITLRGSVPEVTVDVDPKYGSTVAVEGKASLADPEWKPATKEHRFFRAVQH